MFFRYGNHACKAPGRWVWEFSPSKLSRISFSLPNRFFLQLFGLIWAWMMAMGLWGEVPRRVVSQAVGTDEFLLALAPESIAALSHLSQDPQFSPLAEEARRFPALKDSGAESILKHRPDLVLITLYTRPETTALLQRAGVKTLLLGRFDSLDDTYANLRFLGKALGKETRAEFLIRETQFRVERLKKRLAGVRPIRVLAPSPYGFTAGRATTFQDLCDHAGALNVAAEAGLVGHAPTPAEKILGWNPEILVASGSSPAQIAQNYAQLPAYRHLPALRKGRIVALPEALLACVSHLRVRAYEALAQALHPERFPKE